MKRDEEGWDGVIPLLRLFGSESSTSVTEYSPNMLDGSIPQKRRDGVIPPPCAVYFFCFPEITGIPSNFQIPPKFVEKSEKYQTNFFRTVSSSSVQWTKSQPLFYNSSDRVSSPKGEHICLSLFVPPTKQHSGWVHPSFSSIQPNITGDELIPAIWDDPIPSLFDAKPNAPEIYSSCWRKPYKTRWPLSLQ